MTKRTKRLIQKFKKPGFWQQLNIGSKRQAHKVNEVPSKQNPREMRAHEHPKQPERNKK